MTPDQVEQIFKPFGRTNKKQPLGVVSNHIGLSISKALVEALGGSIRVTSTPKVGSKFIFTMSVTLVKKKSS